VLPRARMPRPYRFKALGAGDEAREVADVDFDRSVLVVSKPSVRAMRLVRVITGAVIINAKVSKPSVRAMRLVSVGGCGLLLQPAGFKALGAGDEAREPPPRRRPRSRPGVSKPSVRAMRLVRIRENPRRRNHFPFQSPRCGR